MEVEVGVVGRCGGSGWCGGELEGMVEEEVWWRAGGALVNAVVALGEEICSGVLNVGVCKSLILQGFNML